MSRKNQPKAPLKPSHEVYQRLRWDPGFAAVPIFVGFDHHTGALKEIPLHQFIPDGEIPWHRVWHFRTQDGMLWDRKTRIDRVLGSGEADAVQPGGHVAATRSAGLLRRHGEALRFVEGRGWIEGDPRENEPIRPLRLLVLNVLADTYDAEKLRTQERWDHLLVRLEREDADLIALVEVTATLASRLMDAPWVRTDYAVTARASAPQLAPFGALLLSRIAVRSVEWLGVRDVRPAVVAELGIGDAGLRIAVIHLPSDRRESKATARAQQLDALAEALCDGQAAPFVPTLLMGDFNAREAEPFPPRIQVFSDLWTQLHPGDPGFTFDPSRNAIAALNSAHGLAGRLDRVLFADPTGALTTRSCALWGDLPVEGTIDLFLSDHAGLRVDLSTPGQAIWSPMSPGLAAASPTPHAALVLVPPEEIWAPIQAIREQHDRTFHRWMPHINLLYGFVPETHFDEAAVLLTEALAEADPFEIELGTIDMFQHRASATAHLVPTCTPGDALHRLQALLQQRFPRCDELGRRSDEGYTPHLTLAQFAGSDSARQKIRAWEASWKTSHFQVTELCLIARDAETPFRVVKRVALGKPGETLDGPLYELLVKSGTWPDADEDTRIRTALDKLDAMAGQILHGDGAPRVTTPFGSVVLGTRARGGDVDVLVQGPAGVNASLFFDQIAYEISGHEGRVLDRVEDASVPVLKVEIDSIPLDLTYAVEGDEEAWRSRAGVEDGRILRSLLAEGKPGTRRIALRALRAWAQARRVEGTQLGFPGGLAWTVMFLRAIQDISNGSAEELLARAFTVLAAWDGEKPIAITPALARARPRDRADRVMVMTPSSPSFNSTRTFTASTHGILQDELRNALIRIKTAQESGSWGHLLQPLDPDTYFDEQIGITLKDPDEARLSRAWGWLTSVTPKWVVLLEGRGFHQVWPLGQDRSGERTWKVGLHGQRSITQNDLEALQAAVHTQLETHGASVDVRVASSLAPQKFARF